MVGVRFKGLGSTVFALLYLCGCGVETSSGPDRSVAAAQIQSSLEQRTFSNPFGGSKNCSSFFKVLSVRIDGVMAEQKEAKVAATVFIQNNSGHVIYEGQPDLMWGCYGSAANGWQPGQTLTLANTFQFTQWDTGWRLDAQ